MTSQRNIGNFSSASILAVLSAACMLSPSTASAHTYKFHTLYSFCAETNCTDGGGSVAALVMDQAGNLYGTSGGGGEFGKGAVFRLTPPSHGNDWKHKVLYSFCADASCPNGGDTPLIIDGSGNLYGTARSNDGNGGVAFELKPNASGAKWKYKQLYAFPCSGGACPNGQTPSGLTYVGAASGQPYDGTSALFGTAAAGGTGAVAPEGVAFKLEPQNNRWKQTVLYNFCSETDCTDGASPNAPVMDSAGRLWGTTSSGGDDRGGGVLYSISGRHESVEYDFCSDTENCLDGSFPRSPVFLDSAGRIVGTTPLGGSDLSNGFGTLFAVSGGSEQVLYIFCPRGRHCTHGENPSSGVIEDASGNMFGMADGGSADSGVVYEFASGREQVLYTFCSAANCTDGSGPSGGLIIDSAGNLYGTTQGGGTNNSGTVFELEF